MVTLPRTIEDWKALPELPLGRYLVVNLGMMDAPLLACRAAGIQGLPPPEGDEVGLDVMWTTRTCARYAPIWSAGAFLSKLHHITLTGVIAWRSALSRFPLLVSRIERSAKRSVMNSTGEGSVSFA
jgi:hypothetical protein